MDLSRDVPGMRKCKGMTLLTLKNVPQKVNMMVTELNIYVLIAHCPVPIQPASIDSQNKDDYHVGQRNISGQHFDLNKWV